MSGRSGSIPPRSRPAPERPRPAPGEDVLWSDVEPIFLKVCAKCHSDNSKVGGPPEGLRLDTWEHALAAEQHRFDPAHGLDVEFDIGGHRGNTAGIDVQFLTRRQRALHDRATHLHKHPAIA